MNFNRPSVLSDSLTTAPSSGLNLSSASGSPLTGSVLSPPSVWGKASSIAFIDASVSDYQTLVAGVAPGTEVHVLNSSEDAVTQITNTLMGRSGISSLHIVSHGEAGGLDFGSGVLNLTDLPTYASQLQSWSNALTSDADILLYGCNVAQGEIGKAFTSILSQLTGADVAASTDLTGNASKGGDWELEYNFGRIEAAQAFTKQAEAAYQDVLASISGNIWQDKNSNKVQDAGELGFAGVNVFLDQNRNGVRDGGEITAATDASGNYSFTGLATGTYFVEIDSASGSIQRTSSKVLASGVTTISLDSSGGSTPMGVAFNPTTQNYYGATGGGSSSPNFVYSNTGTRLQSTSINRDLRAWNYNPTTGQLEGITFNAQAGGGIYGLFSAQLDGAGLFTGATTTILSSVPGNAGAQTMPAYDPIQNRFYSAAGNNVVNIVSRATGASQGTITLNFATAGISSVNNAAIGYDPVSNYLVVAANSPSPQAAVFDLGGNFIGSSKLPSVSTSYGLSFTNGQLFSNTSSAWQGYRISSNVTITTASENATGINLGALSLNNPPVLDLNGAAAGTGFTASFIEGMGTVGVVDKNNLTLTDDGTTITSATATLSNLLDGTAESLSANAGSTGIVISYNSGTGVLSLSGSSSIANYQQVLRTVAYNDTSTNPNTTPRTINFVVNDGNSNSATVTSTVNLTAVDNPSVLTVSDTSSYTENAAAGLVAPTLTVSDPDGLNGAKVSIGTNFDVNDRLGIQGQGGTSGTISGLTWNYDPTKGILTFTGAASAAVYQAALRQVVYSNVSETPIAGDRSIQFALGAGLANPENGHYYEFVNAGGAVSWTAARDAAAARNYFGLQGYLVTVTSAAESSFVSSKLQGQGWLGASDETVEGDWRWVTGPEAGQQFWQGLGNGGSVVGGKYNNWNPGEPNNAGNEDYGQFLLNGKWNDLPLNPGSISGYVVEYGGLQSDPTLQLTGNATVTVIAVNDAPTVTAAPATIAITEDTTTALTGITFADVDAGSSNVTATLTVGAGTLAAITGSGVTVGGTATNLTLDGTVAAINNFIAGNQLTYTTDLNATTAQTLGVSINDNGNVGTGGALTSAVTNVALNVTAVNDAPTVLAPPTITVTEDVTTILTGIVFSDVDAGGGNVTATLTVGAGILAATSGNGVTVGGTATNLTLDGTIGAINGFIAGNQLTYTTAANSITAQTLGVNLNDGGNTGTGGALNSGVTNVNLMVTPVNDAPSFTKGTDQTITAGTGIQTLTNWATGFNPGPLDESGQTVQAYDLTVDTNPGIFAVAPAIDTFGNLTYTPATNIATPTTATISVRVRDNGGIANGGIDQSAVQTFAITVKPQPTISIATVSQNEGNSGTTAYTFTVSLNDTSTQTVRVNYATADSTATIADSDYSAASGTLTFAPGDTSKTFTVNVNGDNRYENTEAFLVNLSNAINGTIATGSNSVNGTITNDDTVPVVNITPTVTHAEGNSGTTPYDFTVTLSNSSFEAIAINYSTSDGTATIADGDYTAANGIVNFAPGEISKTITVNAIGDTTFEPDQAFQVKLTGSAVGSGAVSLGNTVGTGAITNDDTQPIISIGNVSQVEGNSGTTAYTFTVSLSNASAQAVAVNYTTADGTATAASGDFVAANGSLSFAAGETSKTITINANGDPNRELDETFSVKLLTPTNATLAASANIGVGTIVNDDRVNLVWRSDPSPTLQGTGKNAIWQLNGFTLESGYYLPPVADANWQIISTADFNNDGTADLLWRNKASGENAIWQLNSTGLQAGHFITPLADLNWQIASTADFNNDGIADIVWRNKATGQNAIWQMKSDFTVQTGYFITPLADANWQIASTADFNNDGIADLLWRNKATGQNAIWQMKSDFTVQSGRFITPLADANWQIAGTADFNNDGIADIVWRNKATGQNAIWQMNSTDVQTGYFITPRTDANWQISGIADFNGDGSPDLLWRNPKTGKVEIWKMNGFADAQVYQLPDESPDWSSAKTLQAPKADPLVG